MKVAVLSAVPTSGKTAFMEVLGGVFSLSQGRDVAIFSTGELSELIDIVVDDASEKDLSSPDVVKAMVEANAGDKMLLDYGVQAGMEHVYIYDIMGIDMPIDDRVEFLLESIKAIPVDLTLIEISGDPQSDLNKLILNECDCSIMLIEPSMKAIKSYVSYITNIPACPAKYNMALVASRINYNIISDKQMASKMSIRFESMYKYPYNPIIPKLSLAGALDGICEKIVIGDPSVVQLRMPLYEIMTFLFDQPNIKVIRSIDQWYR